VSNIVRLPVPALPEDPLEALQALMAEYGAASNAERNYGSCRYAHLMWSYLTGLMPVIEQRRADRRARAEAAMEQILDGPQPPRLRVVDGVTATGYTGTGG
jgi:hypothetical protein